MRKVLLQFLLAAFVFIANLQAQAPPTNAVVNASPSPSVEEKKTDSEAAKKTTNNSEKEDPKKTKSAVNVSPRFRETIAPEKLSPVRIPRIETPPVIDGKLNEEIWKQAAVFKDFYQTAPGDNIAPSKPTIAYMAYDAENLYIAFYCYDEPDKIRATIAKRDGVFGEDNVRVHLDTYDDQRRAFVLGFNPLGIQQDGIYTEGGNVDFSVDVVMESKGVIVSDGWTLEVKVPFKSLRYSAGKGKNWGIHVSRNIDRFNDEFDSWMPQDPNISSWLAQEGKITGLENIKVERTLELVPSITLSETGRRRATFPTSSGRFVNGGIDNDIGLNLKFNITPNITFDAAFNPDFAEIEADALVVTTNQRFPIFFQEKRPFFLEGADIFQSPLQPFYSRTIVDPDIATKLTGKVGKNTFGFLIASDNAPGNYSEDELLSPTQRLRAAEFLKKNATFAVARVKRDFGKENNIGFFGTARMFPEQRNFVGGFDGKIRWNDRTISQFQVLGTHSRRCFFDPAFEPLLEPTQANRNREICQTGTSLANASPYNRYRTGNGAGYYFNADYTEKNRGWFFEANGRTRDYRADAGFTRRTNNNRLMLAGRFSTEPKPKAKIIRFDVRPFSQIAYDFQGRSTDINIGSNFSVSLQRNTFLFFETGAYYERIFEEEFGLKRGLTRGGAFFGEPERSTWQHYVSGNINTTPHKRISLGAFFGFTSNAFDFDFGGGPRFPRVSPAALAGSSKQDPGSGRQWDMNAYVELRPTDPLRISFSYNKSHLTRNDTGLTVFDSNIFTLRSTYQFTRFTFVRARWDYDSISSNARGQLLFGWNPNPGTAVYVGYNDNFNYNGFNPFTGELEPRFERNSRTFFIRASYLFRKSF